MPRLVVRLDRWKRACAIGLTVTLASSLLMVSVGAATISTYRDNFLAESFSGSDGPEAWSTSWIETGEADGPGDGAVEVKSDGHCDTDTCLLLGKDGPMSAAVSRAFDASGGDIVTLTFDYLRHVHGAGLGSVVLSASSDGVVFSPVTTYQLSTDDGSQQAASHDLSAFAGGLAWIQFELIDGDDNSHMNIDNLQIVIDSTDVPILDQDLTDRTDIENDTISMSSGASHPGGDTLVYSATGLPPGVTIDPGTGLIAGTLSYTASAASPYSTQITVTDGDGDTDIDTFTWTVADLNRQPSAGDRALNVPEDDPGTLIDLLDPASASDPDGDVLTIVSLDLSGLAAGSIVDNGDDTVTYVPSPNFDQSESFTYTLTDGKGGDDTGTVTLNVTAGDDPPTLTPLARISVAEGALAGATASATDPDTGDNLVFSLVPGPDPVPAAAFIDASTGEFAWLTTEADGPGTYEFQVEVADGSGLTDLTAIRVDVAEANQDPMLGAIAPADSAEGETVSIKLVVTDPDIPKGKMTFSAAGLPAGVKLDPTTGQITGKLTFESAGSHTITISVTDDGSPAKTDSKTFTWTVSPTNRVPHITLTPEDMSVEVGKQMKVEVGASDSDGDTLIYKASGLPDGIAIDAATGVISGSPVPAAGGTVSLVEIDVIDSAGAVAKVSFVITVPASTTTTTSPHNDGATTTSAPVTTTTVAPTTTTAVAPTTTTLADAAPPPPPADPPSGMTVAEVVKAKAGLVVSSGNGDSDLDIGQADGNGHIRLDPREGLTVTFRSAVETLQNQLASAVALGVSASIILLIGVDREDRRDRTRPA